MSKYIVVRQDFNASIELVFPVFCKHRIFNTLLWPLHSVVIRNSQDPHNRDGIGSVRHMGIGPFKFIQEEVTQIVPNHMIEYQMLSNAIFPFHLGRLEFEARDGCTSLSYSIWLDSHIPLLSTLVLSQLRWSVTRGLRKVAGHIERSRHQPGFI